MKMSKPQYKINIEDKIITIQKTYSIRNESVENICYVTQYIKSRQDILNDYLTKYKSHKRLQKSINQAILLFIKFAKETVRVQCNCTRHRESIFLFRFFDNGTNSLPVLVVGNVNT